MKHTTLHVVKPEPNEPRTPATSKRWKDKEWRHVRSESTNLHKTFARVRQDLAEQTK